MGFLEFFLKFVFFLIFVSINQCNADCKNSITSHSGSDESNVIQVCSGDLIFEENFDELDQSKWKHEVTLSGGGNNEFQWYVNDRENSFIKDGNLHIKPTLTADTIGEEELKSGTVEIPTGECTDDSNWGCKRIANPGHSIINPIRSARISTKESFSFKYGIMEIRAKMPAGDWIWPALWLLPRNSVYGGWPRSGEIDLIELRGNRQLYNGDVNVGVEQMGSTMHFGPAWNQNGWPTAHATKNKSPGFDSDFHVYKLIWTDKEIQFLIDDESVLKVQPNEGFWKRGGFRGENPWSDSLNPLIAPFDQEFYIIINNAVGGTMYFADNFENRPYPKSWLNNSPRASLDFWNDKDNWIPTWNLHNDDNNLIVDFVKVWAL